jgi:hypothetical protein
MTDPEHLVKKVIILNDGTFRIDGGMLVYGVPKYYGRKETREYSSIPA